MILCVILFSVSITCLGLDSSSVVSELTPLEAIRASTNNESLECFENVNAPLLFWNLSSLETKLSLAKSLSLHDVTLKRDLLSAVCMWLWTTEPGLLSLQVYLGDQLIKTYKNRTNAYSSFLSDQNNTYWRCDDHIFVEHIEVLFENRITMVIEANLSTIVINQCDKSDESNIINGTNKCHHTTDCVYKKGSHQFSIGNYWCVCKSGYYSILKMFDGMNIEEATFNEIEEKYSCHPCSEGCDICSGPESCMAQFSWVQRSIFLSITILCIVLTIILIWFVHKNRRIKVFRIASPTFLIITLVGCIIMYSEMGIMFPQCNQQLCVATKWTRHFGFCITYSALLMKTWRVSLTYRVKSAHKLKLTDNQLLQWMAPILGIILVYMGAWTFSDPPQVVLAKSEEETKFWQCSNDWWDHCLAVGEVLFLAWGVRVCYVVRNAESFYNEAKLISFAIYNIFIVNVTMMAIHFLLFPNIGPDLKYTLAFIRTQLSTSVTIGLVFGSKIVRVINGQGDNWDTKLQPKGIISYEMDEICDEPIDLQTENDQLKEEIVKLATNIGIMRNSLMLVNNRHLKKNGCPSCNPLILSQQSPTNKSGGFFRSLGSNNCLSPLSNT
ncbi:probable G-protein coupled receptor CG31760 [Daktulosphaira vitifoliae]|uniref:probable G-protein coupled receptor CG31760 n=1 Tax=Daktulosphaira vitifoliae TaxID=58002 RepID=UPI0021AA1501|nr:probable G-protein coupled receptor CG31760 [Daktulosphaira vitifoliae]